MGRFRKQLLPQKTILRSAARRVLAKTAGGRRYWQPPMPPTRRTRLPTPRLHSTSPRPARDVYHDRITRYIVNGEHSIPAYRHPVKKLTAAAARHPRRIACSRTTRRNHSPNSDFAWGNLTSVGVRVSILHIEVRSEHLYLCGAAKRAKALWTKRLHRQGVPQITTAERYYP